MVEMPPAFPAPGKPFRIEIAPPAVMPISGYDRKGREEFLRRARAELAADLARSRD